MADGRFALITGGAQGMGFTAAKRFLELEFGGVMLLDRNGAKLKDAAANLKSLGQVETIKGDLADITLAARMGSWPSRLRPRRHCSPWPQWHSSSIGKWRSYQPSVLPPHLEHWSAEE